MIIWLAERHLFFCKTNKAKLKRPKGLHGFKLIKMYFIFLFCLLHLLHDVYVCIFMGVCVVFFFSGLQNVDTECWK